MISIKQPTLIIDKEKCLENINFLSDKAKKNKIKFRPHFKTHQSAIIGQWFREYGVNAITVSSVQMAKYFASHGWNDITIAFPLNPLEINEINQLAQKNTINLLVSSDENIQETFLQLKYPTGIYIEIDDGYHRSGLQLGQIHEIENIINRIVSSTLLGFKGFLVHSGNTYHAKSREEIIRISDHTIKKLVKLKHTFSGAFDVIELSIGDTPSCSLKDSFDGIDEIRPGNFIFYDIMQLKLGTCMADQIAVVLACPVLAKYPERNELVVYGGAVHLSKESILDHNGYISFGQVIQFIDNKWGESLKNTWVSSLSQEHGIIKTTSEMINQINIGDIVGILPVHSCLTADLQPHYLTTEMEVIPKMTKEIYRSIL